MVIKLQGQLDAERPFTLLAWGHWFAFANLLMALVLSFFYIDANPAPDTILGCAFLLLTWVGHFAFLCLSAFILTIFPVVTLFPYQKHIRGISALIASILQLYLFLDVLAYRGLGYHLSTSSINQLREVEDVYLASLGSGYWLLLLSVFAFILLYQFVASNFTWKRIHWLQSFRYKNQLASSLFTCFMLSHFIHIWADATLNQDIAKQGALFPGSYPLTAKTLLARHGLIDLDEYKISKSKQAMLNSTSFKMTPPISTSCEVSKASNLDVYLVAKSDSKRIARWLRENNLAFQQTKQLNLARDLDTTLFNFETGLPGLYQYSDKPTDYYINNLLDLDKIRIQISTSSFDLTQELGPPSSKRVFVFYDQATDEKFYRTNAFLVGFPKLDDVPVNPQNIIATYLEHGLNCPSYVQNNLVDKGYPLLGNDEILTNFTNGYLHLIFKDKTMLFKNGKLIANQTFSTQQTVDEPISIHIVQKAIQVITKKKQK